MNIEMTVRDGLNYRENLWYFNPLIPRTFNIYDMFRVLTANKMKVIQKNKSAQK